MRRWPPIPIIGVSSSAFFCACASFFFSSTHASRIESSRSVHVSQRCVTFRVCSAIVLIMKGIAKSIKLARQPSSITTSGFTRSEQLQSARSSNQSTWITWQRTPPCCQYQRSTATNSLWLCCLPKSWLFRSHPYTTCLEATNRWNVDNCVCSNVSTNIYRILLGYKVVQRSVGIPTTHVFPIFWPTPSNQNCHMS